MTVTTTQTSPSHSNLTGSVHQHQPSVASLVRSTAVSAAVAAVLAVTCVLPAEYAIDPTGAGHVLGLTQMGQIKMSLAAENAKAAPVANAPDRKSVV